MAQRKKKPMKRKKSSTHRDHELQSDDEEFEVAAGIKDDQDTSSRRLPRFPASSECVSDVELDTRELTRAQNKKKKKSGGFQSMGETMDDQFAALHENPDIRLPDARQTLLFSATLPKMIVDFARAGLTEPVLIRLDVDTKLSDQLKLSFFHLRLDDKPALLLHLLRNVVKPQEQTVVFVATKHHVEHLKELLMVEGFECAYIYSALHQTARKINIGRFVHRKAMVLLVTDVSARGIDIPLLDNVINYNFPSKAKLFLHRVGRVARAGKKGTAFSLVCTDEVPYLYDLHLFLGRPIQLALPEHTQDSDDVFGCVPQSILDDEESQLLTAHENSLDLQNLRRISENSYKQYLKSRPNPSPESIKRVKNTDLSSIAVHPLLGSGLEPMELDRLLMVDTIKGYKAKSTIFEINSNNKMNASEVMRAKRSQDDRLVDKFSKVRAERIVEHTLPTVTRTEPQHNEDEQEDDELQVSNDSMQECSR
uniref:ATP-dependent RNA helicase DDX54-like n=1 Tax=Sinocyclocheilus anshuiensis TaxID=1608454 RepID=A0A671MGG2_9TELE